MYCFSAKYSQRQLESKARAVDSPMSYVIATPCDYLYERTIGFESACRTATAASALIKPLISSKTSDHSSWSSGSYLQDNSNINWFCIWGDEKQNEKIKKNKIEIASAYVVVYSCICLSNSTMSSRTNFIFLSRRQTTMNLA